MTQSLFLIDGHYQIHRAFHAPLRDPSVRGGQLTSPTGEPTQATFVFCGILFKLIQQYRPDYLAVCLDVDDRSVFRCEIDPNYKANRDEFPELLQQQERRIIEIITALGIPILREPGFEADDLAATLATRLAGPDLRVVLVSRDKDLEQLLGEHVVMLDAHKQEDAWTGPAELLAKKGYTPAQAVDIQTLTGDSTDNVPGVPGIGPKTAVKLISQFGSAEQVLAHADKLTPKQAENIKAYADQLPRTRQLVTLRTDVPVAFDLQAARAGGFTYAGADPIFEELGFGRLRDTLSVLASRAGQSPADSASAEVPSPGTAAATGEQDYRLIDTPELLAGFVADLAEQPRFAFDTETTSLSTADAELVGLSFAWQAGVAYYIPVRGLAGRTLPCGEVLEALRPILEDPAVEKVGQNLKYDVLVLRHQGVPVRGLAFDTMIAAFVLDPLRPSLSLDGLSLALLGYTKIPTSDLIGSGRHQITMDQVPVADVCTYACEDADMTWRLYECLAGQLAGSPMRDLFTGTEMPLVEVLVGMEHAGVALDADVLRKLSDELADRLIDLRKQAHRAAGHEFNLDSPKQLANVLFDEQDLPVIRKTKTGRSTDADTLATLIERTDHPIPKLVNEYRELAKLKGTYLDPLPQMVNRRTGRVHASFNQTVAVTGRLSSSDPNLQNIPVRTQLGRKIRAAFVAPSPDWVLLVADYSQVELRLLAHFCQDEALLTAFREGQDIHRSVAAAVHGVSLEAVTPEQRSAAKAVNFGIIYGQTPFGLARGLGISVGEAKTFIDAYFARYPGIQQFTTACIAEARDKGFAATILGRRRPVPELHSRNKQQVAFGERIAVNTVVQGSAADLIKRAMIDIHQALTDQDHPARLLLQVHDELVFEVPRTEVDATAELVREKMTTALPLTVPLAVDVGSGANWYEAK